MRLVDAAMASQREESPEEHHTQSAGYIWLGKMRYNQLPPSHRDARPMSTGMQNTYWEISSRGKSFCAVCRENTRQEYLASQSGQLVGTVPP